MKKKKVIEKLEKIDQTLTKKEQKHAAKKDKFLSKLEKVDNKIAKLRLKKTDINAKIEKLLDKKFAIQLKMADKLGLKKPKGKRAARLF